MSSVSPPPSSDAVRATLRGVIDPELGENVVELGMVRDVTVDPSGSIRIDFALTTASCPLRTQLRSDVITRVSALPGAGEVKVKMGAMDREERAALMAKARWKARDTENKNEIPADTRVLAIASGKGGVGKSTVTVNLATALAEQGFTVGVLDADIAGFSIPQLLGVGDRLDAKDGKIHPFVKPVGTGQLKIVSMGLIEGSGASEAVMLRGLMLNRALQHFLEDVKWGPMDYLLIDMPPGTGDVQMGLARMLPRTDVLVITTPATAAQQVAARAVDMARRGYLRVAGVIENMSPVTEADGSVTATFGSGGGERLALDTNVPLLAQIPLDAAVSSGGDNGVPVVSAAPTSVAGLGFTALAKRIIAEVSPPVEMSGCTNRLLQAAAAALDKLDAPPA